MIKKERNTGSLIIHAGLLITFFCLHIFINILFTDSNNLIGSATKIDSGIFSVNSDHESTNPFADQDENTKCETDTISESISESSHINHPLFSIFKKRTNYHSGLHFPDHFELLSPPPEFRV